MRSQRASRPSILSAAKRPPPPRLPAALRIVAGPRAEEGDRAALPHEVGGRFVEGGGSRHEERRMEQLVEDRVGERDRPFGGDGREERIREPPERAEGER